MLTFLRLAGQLKRIPRSGWVHYKIPNPESVAEHTSRCGLAAIAIGASPRATKMALVHDLAEALVGDITPLCGVSEDTKRDWERAALHKIVRHVDPAVAEEVVELWEEFEDGTSEDARVVKDIDKLELILQADEYEEAEQASANNRLQPFFDCTQDVFQTDQVRDIAVELRRQRADRLAACAEPVETAMSVEKSG